jgi:hypothetical protein
MRQDWGYVGYHESHTDIVCEVFYAQNSPKHFIYLEEQNYYLFYYLDIQLHCVWLSLLHFWVQISKEY